MKCVSNTSPMIFLEKLDALPVLARCFTEIYMPRAVYHELGDLQLPEYIHVRAVSPAGQQFVLGAMGRLHAGELEAMALTREIQADYLCLDDLTARRKAQRLGLQVIGTVGVLQLAYRLGHLPAQLFLDHLDALTKQHGMYLSPGILHKLQQFLRKE